MTTIIWYDNDTKTQNRFHTSFCAFRAERGVFLELTMLAKEFIFDCQARELVPRTIRNYEKQISYFIRYLEEVQNVTLLEELKPIHIKQYVVMLVKKKHWFLFRQTGISLVQNVVITDNTSIYSRWYYTGLIKPFVQNVSKVSVEPLCSTIFPSTTLSMSTPVISKTLLVGVIPRKSPLWVPRMINSEIT